MSNARPPSYSTTSMTEIVLPQHANALGTVFGGQVMAWIDICAAITAHRHCGRISVTVSVDELTFLAPVHVGDIVNLRGQLNAVFGTSMEVQVELDVEYPDSGTRKRCVEAFLTFVSLGPDGKPCPAPPMVVETEEEAARERAARTRREERLARR